MKKLICFSLIALSMSSYGQSDFLESVLEEKSLGPKAASIVQFPESDQVSVANVKFMSDLYRKLKTNKGNLFFSPLSISAALSMTYAGAKGETANQMAKGLRIKGITNVHSKTKKRMDTIFAKDLPYEVQALAVVAVAVVVVAAVVVVVERIFQKEEALLGKFA